MSRVTLYTTEPCGFCRTAKALLAARRIPYEEINLSKDPDGRAQLRSAHGHDDVPPGRHRRRGIGGYQELVRADRAGSLRELAAAA